MQKPVNEAARLLEQCHPPHPQPEICQACIFLGRVDNQDNFHMMMDLSTAHMPQTNPDFGSVRNVSHEYGYVVWLTDSDDDGAQWLKPILAIARKHKCLLINFDSDAATFDGLKTYEW